MEAHPRTIEFQLLAMAHGLCATGEILSIAQAHNVKRFLSREHGAVARAGMVRMAVRDKGSLDRTNWIDIEAAGAAANTRSSRHKNIFDTHDL